jgi:hypothetical protein
MAYLYTLLGLLLYVLKNFIDTKEEELPEGPFKTSLAVASLITFVVIVFCAIVTIVASLWGISNLDLSN